MSDQAERAKLHHRFIAHIIDLLILLPVLILIHFVIIKTSIFEVMLVMGFIHFAVIAGYFIHFHSAGGQTLGKRFAQIKVVRTDGSDLDVKTATMRRSVWGALALIGQAVFVVSALSIGKDAFNLAQAAGVQSYYDGLGFIESAGSSVFVITLSFIGHAWMIADAVAVLCNKDRKSLHDMVAGTVVVYESEY